MVCLQSVIVWCDYMRTDVSSAGYKYLASRMKKEEEDPDGEQAAQDEFLLQLDEMENLLSKHAGPYLVGCVQPPPPPPPPPRPNLLC